MTASRRGGAGTTAQPRPTDRQGRRARALRRARTMALALVVVALTACAIGPPRNPNNACAIFAERRGWWDAVRDSERRWGVPPHIQLAIIQRESSFVADARPDRRKILFVIPWRRPSSAYGYAQAVDPTWDRYKRAANRPRADRDSFRDAADFVGWYGRQSARQSGIAVTDAYNQYLAYHEGWGGFNRGSYRGDGRLQRAARGVANQAARYERQIAGCRRDLRRFWPFF